MAEPIKKMEKKRDPEESQLLQTRWQHSVWDLEQIRLSMVLQDCADQLAVLGHIACIAAIQENSEEDKEMWETLSGALVAEEGGPAESARERRRALVELRHALDNKPLSPDNLEKVEHDRQFLALVIKDMLDELQEAGTFDSLLAAVEEEKRQKANHLDIVQREEEGRRRGKALQRQLRDLRKERAQEVHQREEITAHLRAQLQEMKAKAAMERDYMRGISHLKVQQSQEHNVHREVELEATVERLQERIAEERFIHEEVENFLKEVQTDLEERLEAWMEAYETDMEAKQKETDTLKNSRARTAERLQELREELERMATTTPSPRGAQEEEETEEREEEEQEEARATPQEEPQDE